MTCTPDAPQILQISTRPAASARAAFRLRDRADQQAPSGRRGERHRDLKLGIIVAAGALIGFGPAMIEHIFAARVALQIAGRGRDQTAVGGAGQHMLGLPAGTRAD